MINALSFRQNLNTSPILQAKPHSLKSSVALSAQPQRDEVSFGLLNLEKCKKILIEKFYPEDTTIKLIKEIEIKQHQDGVLTSVKAYLTETEKTQEDELNFRTKGLAVFSKEGQLLGDIKTMYPSYQLNFIKNRDVVPEIKNYLFLPQFNASYQAGYKGVGSALIDAAIQKSKEMELSGQIGLQAFNNVNPEIKGSPIPFYAKKGFVPKDAPHLTKNEIIEKYKTGNECVGMFLLTPENLEKLKEYKKKHPPKSPKPNITDRLMHFLFGNFV